jgi:hypothetical protein
MLAIGAGFACLAMGREAVAGDVIGATATVSLNTSNGPDDGKWTVHGTLTAEESRTAHNEYSIPGSLQGTWDANAFARVDATQVDPVSHRPIIDFAGRAFADNTGLALAGSQAIADMKYSDVVSLRPYFGISPDPRYAPGAQRPLYFHVDITGSITNQIAANPFEAVATSIVRLSMNGTSQLFDIEAQTDPVHFKNYPDNTRWFTSGNWDSITVDANGNYVGSATLVARYDSSQQGYAYTLETALETDATSSTAYIAGLRSAHLVGIAYADGTTPESHGYQIVDLTGFPSPNVAIAIPEPSPLLLAGLGLTLLAAGRSAHVLVGMFMRRPNRCSRPATGEEAARRDDSAD